MRMSSDISDALRKHDGDLESLLKKLNQKEVAILRQDERVLRMEQAVKDYADLVDTLSDK